MAQKTLSTKEDRGDWNIHSDTEGTWATGSIQCFLLADIRRELRTLNRTLSCHRVPAMADAMIRLEKRIAKRIPLRSKKR